MLCFILPCLGVSLQTGPYLQSTSVQPELARDADNLLWLAGKKGATLADLRAINPLTQCTHIPHEVKAPCAEAYGDSDFPELVHDADNRKQMARPATQILYYMVRP